MKASGSLAISTIIGSWLAAPVLGAYDPVSVKVEMTEQQSKWTNQGIKNYNFMNDMIGDTSGMAYPFTTQVRNGAVSSFKDANNQDITALSPSTLDSYFKLIDLELTNGAPYIDVTYDATRGFPAEVYIQMTNGRIFHAKNYGFVITSRRLRGGNRDLQSAAQTTQIQELARNEALWKSKAIFNYGFQYKELGANPYNVMWPFTMTVRNGVQATATDGNGNPTINWQPPKPQPQTMEDLFQRIRTAFTQNVPIVQATYNAASGYPEDIYIVYDDKVADATYDAEIFNFKLE